MDKFLTTDEVTQHLSLHQNTVIRYIREGKLSAVKVGNAYRIKESTFTAFVGETAKLPDTSARIIAIANQKGGVAKTTTAINLAASLATQGKRILLIDLEPQSGSAVSLGIDTSSLQRTVYNVLTWLVQKWSWMKQVLAQETVLQRRLQPVLEQYGYTLIDCPPSLGILTTNALTVARYVLIPCACA